MEYGKITPFTVHCAAISDEDAPPEATEKLLIVCDGLGGTGQTKHKIGDQYYTSAYIGSRCVSDAIKKYCDEQQRELWTDDIATMTKKLKQYLASQLEACIQGYKLEKSLGGNMIELLPTTLAMAIFRKNGGFLDLRVIWAGDSRVYLLTPVDGLSQLSEDDVDGEFDAMKALGQSNMNNNVTGEGMDRFHLNYAEYKIPIQEGFILFAASDGCFDYIESPMQFEYKLLAATQQVFEDDPSVLGECIAENYQGENCKDDTTIAGVVIQTNQEKTVSELYKARMLYMKEQFRKPVNEGYRFADSMYDEIDSKRTQLEESEREIETELIEAVIAFLKQSPAFDMQEELKSRILKMGCLANYFYARLQNKKELQKAQKEIQEELQKKKEAEQSLNSLIENFVKNYIQKTAIPQKKILFWDKKRDPVCELVEEYRELSKIQKSEEESDSDVDLRMKQIYQEIRYELEQSGEINRIRLQSDELNRMQGHDKTVVRLKEKIKSLQKNQDIEQYIRKIKTRVCWESLYIFGMERILTGEAKKKFLKLQADFKHIEDLKYEAEKFESIPGLFWRDYYKGKYEKYKPAKSQGKV